MFILWTVASDTPPSTPAIFWIYTSKKAPKNRFSKTKIVDFISQNNPAIPTEKIRTIVDIYFQESAIESINVWVALSQMIVETAFLRFTGNVRPEQNNFAGIGCVDNAARGASFASVREGIRAHIQHLKAYASRESLHRPCVDPRRHFIETGPNFGTVQTVFDLCGTWAMDSGYGPKLARITQQLYQAARLP
ncbi:MAG: glucosaminidase domain-containing protein [Verrucomicrobiota bacterium]|nr:MAG: glucosaminidase domain-containing protein [Verrucomicrobiota bacterium]